MTRHWQVTPVVTEPWLQLGASTTGLPCALTPRSIPHVASNAPRQKGTTSTAPILEYPLPAGPFDVVGLDLLQFRRSTQGSGYILVCVDHFSRFVVLAPLRDRSAVSVADELVSHLIFPYMTPRVLLTDNGTEFKNQVVADIYFQYGVKQTFITTHHPASNGLVERTNREILEILRHLSGNLHETWEDWRSQVAANIISSVNSFTGKTLITWCLGAIRSFHMTFFCNPLSLVQP